MKGGVYSITLQQFKRAVGVAIVQGNARHNNNNLLDCAMYEQLQRKQLLAAATCNAKPTK